MDGVVGESLVDGSSGSSGSSVVVLVDGAAVVSGGVMDGGTESGTTEIAKY